MQIRTEEISEIIEKQIKGYDQKVEVSETGVVVSVGDGIARLYGLDKAMAGRVGGPRGQPLDGKGPIETAEYRNVEEKAPGVVSRLPVKEPLQTGVKAI